MHTDKRTMLDPSWTTERGYSHAYGILERLRRHDSLIAARKRLVTPEARLLRDLAMPLLVAQRTVTR